MPAVRAKHTDAVWHSIFYSIENVCGHDVVVIVRDEVVSVRRLEILHRGLDLVGVEVPLLNAGGRIVERLKAHIVHADFVVRRVVECDLSRPVDAWVVARVDVSLQHGRELASVFLPGEGITRFRTELSWLSKDEMERQSLFQYVDNILKGPLPALAQILQFAALYQSNNIADTLGTTEHKAVLGASREIEALKRNRIAQLLDFFPVAILNGLLQSRGERAACKPAHFFQDTPRIFGVTQPPYGEVEARVELADVNFQCVCALCWCKTVAVAF